MDGNYYFLSFIRYMNKHLCLLFFLSIILLFSILSSSLIKVSLRLKITKVISYVFVPACKCELFFYSRDAYVTRIRFYITCILLSFYIYNDAIFLSILITRVAESESGVGAFFRVRSWESESDFNHPTLQPC